MNAVSASTQTLDAYIEGETRMKWTSAKLWETDQHSPETRMLIGLLNSPATPGGYVDEKANQIPMDPSKRRGAILYLRIFSLQEWDRWAEMRCTLERLLTLQSRGDVSRHPD